MKCVYCGSEVEGDIVMCSCCLNSCLKKERIKTLEEVEKIIKNIMSNTNEDKIVSSWLELRERIEKMKGDKR